MSAIVKGAKESRDLARGQFIGQARVLERDAEPLAQVAVRACPTLAKDFDVSRCRSQKAFENFDRGRFAGAVGAEQAKDFAGSRIKANVIDGPHFAAA